MEFSHWLVLSLHLLHMHEETMKPLQKNKTRQ